MSIDARTKRLRAQAADTLAERLRGLIGSDDFVIVDIAYAYLQFAGITAEEGEGLHLELPSNTFLPKGRALSAEAEAALVGMELEAPGDGMPNFYALFGYEYSEQEDSRDDFEEAIDEVARVVIDALIEVYGFSADLVAGALGVKLPGRHWHSGPPPATNRKGLIKHDRLPEVEAGFATACSAAGDPTDLALFFALVDKRHPDEVQHLLALAPAGVAGPAPIWWEYVAGGWAPNPHVADMLAEHRRNRLLPLEGSAVRTLERELLGSAGITTGS